MEKLYTTKEISEKYSVSTYMITHTWVKNGLKHIKGGRNSFLYKLEWIEEYLNNNIIQNNMNIEKIDIKQISTKKIKKCVNMVV